MSRSFTIQPGPTAVLLCLLVLIAAPVPAVSLRFLADPPVFTTEQPVRAEVVREENYSPQEGMLVLGEGTGFRILDNLGRLAGRFAAGVLHISATGLPPGYYQILDDKNAVLGDFVVVIPVEDYPNTDASPVAVDTALAARTGLVEWTGITEEYLARNVKMLRAAGVRWSRERYGPQHLYPGSGPLEMVNDTVEYRAHEQAYALQESAGVNVTNLMHPSLGRLNSENEPLLPPDDLRDAYFLGLQAGRAFGDSVAEWEIGNEVDLPGFFAGGAHEYASYAKASYWGLIDGDPGGGIAISSFAKQPGEFASAIMESQMASYFDFFNYHSYNDPAAQYNEAQNTIEFMNRWGIGSYPLLLTETGLLMRADQEKDFLPQDSEEVAVHIAKLFAELTAAGVDRSYYFLWKFFKNGQYGTILDGDFQPTERLAALATVNRMLGDGNHLGVASPKLGIRAHLYDLGTSRSLILWSESTATERVEIECTGEIEVVHLTGEPYPFEAVNGGASFDVGPMPVYLGAESIAVDFQPTRIRREPNADHPPPSRLVIDLTFDSEVEYDRGVGAFLLGSGESAEAALEVYNFGDELWEGNLSLDLGGGWDVDAASLELAVEPMGRVQVPIVITAGPAPGERLIDRLTVLDIREPASRLVVRFAHPYEDIPASSSRPLLDEFLSSHFDAFFRSSDVSAQWGRSGEAINYRFTNLRDGVVWFGAADIQAARNGEAFFDFTGEQVLRVRVRFDSIQPGSLVFVWLQEPGGVFYQSANLEGYTAPGEYEIYFPIESFFWSDNSTPDPPTFSLDEDRIIAVSFGVTHAGAQRRGYPEVLEAGYTVEFDLLGIDLLRWD